MAIPKNFDSKILESKWYNFWMKNNYFRSTPNDKTPFTIVIPPPNVTGILHMGHMLNNTIQDILIRKARLQGFNACWIPGTDHASIATEAKVVSKLKSQGIFKNDIDRNEFLKHAWDWTDKHGGLILEQLKKLGCSCDWDRTKFTLDNDMSESVIKVFIDLYNKNLIYKGYRMVNWDPEAKTTLSNEEVIYEEVESKLFFINYKIAGSNELLTVATTRPETIFGDTAIAINSKDKRFRHLKGKKAIIPILNKEIPIIYDDYVDIDFGTGCLKVTPAHSENDKIIGDKHNLEVVDIFNDDATLNKYGLHYEGFDRFEVRSKISNELNKIGALGKTEKYINSVGKSERTKCIIEPRLSEQWFLKMKDISKPALKVVLNDEIKLFPKKFKNTYRNWMENVRDWNISRQLWWGHQIPVYYIKNDKSSYVVAENIEDALEKAKKKTCNNSLKLADLTQDEDVLDTWFSSWIWPISVLDGIRNPNNDDFKYYYPTNDLVTGPDILFFWVARMIVSGLEFKNKIPFSSVYFTGLVRDKEGRKMSKQLGNSPDALKLIEDFGADSVRVGLLLSAPAGNDLLFDESLCQQGKNFTNKVWNSFRLISSWKVSKVVKEDNHSKVAIEWFENKFNLRLKEIEDHFIKYRISDALMCIYKLVWDDFCSWYLELVKPGFEKPMNIKTYEKSIYLFKKCLTIMHPFMPFISEEIWSKIKSEKDNSLIISSWPKVKKVDKGIIKSFEQVKDLVSGVRKLRKDIGISYKEKLTLFSKAVFDKRLISVLLKLSNSDLSNDFSKKELNTSSFLVGSNEYHYNNLKNESEDLTKIKNDLDYNLGFLKSIQAKLNNKKFMENAPKNVLENELNKEKDTLAKISILKSKLNN
ncbi:MAG: valine--tRNA ligase [Flavobacteriaceae bacterium]|nr:valine--tRNA ligase [Flavobacteriaceae bacterium]